MLLKPAGTQLKSVKVPRFKIFRNNSYIILLYVNFTTLIGRNAGHEPAYGQQYTQITKTNMDATICLENIPVKITCGNKRAPDVPVQVSKSDSLRESFCLSAE